MLSFYQNHKQSQVLHNGSFLMCVCRRVRQRGRYYRLIPAGLRRSLHRHSCLKFLCTSVLQPECVYVCLHAIEVRESAAYLHCRSPFDFRPSISPRLRPSPSLSPPSAYLSSSPHPSYHCLTDFSSPLMSRRSMFFWPAFICSRFSPNPAFSLLLSNLLALALPLGYSMLWIAEQSFPIALSNALKINGLRPRQRLDPLNLRTLHCLPDDER